MHPGECLMVNGVVAFSIHHMYNTSTLYGQTVNSAQSCDNNGIGVAFL